MPLTRRRLCHMSALTAAAVALRPLAASRTADISLEIAPFVLDASPKRQIQTIAYNGQVPGPLIRLKQGREVSV